MIWRVKCIKISCYPSRLQFSPTILWISLKYIYLHFSQKKLSFPLFVVVFHSIFHSWIECDSQVRVKKKTSNIAKMCELCRYWFWKLSFLFSSSHDRRKMRLCFIAKRHELQLFFFLLYVLCEWRKDVKKINSQWEFLKLW
jgi:hypothetical protein